MILRRARWSAAFGWEGLEESGCTANCVWEARDAPLDPKARQPWISTLSFSWPIQSLMKALCLWGSGVWLFSWCCWPQNSQKDDAELSAIGYRACRYILNSFWLILTASINAWEGERNFANTTKTNTRSNECSGGTSQCASEAGAHGP